MKRASRWVVCVSSGVFAWAIGGGIAVAQVSVEEAARRMSEREAARRAAAAAAATATRPTGEAPGAAAKAMEHTPLLDARRGFKTHLVNDGTALTGGPAGRAEAPPAGSAYTLVSIPGPAGRLAAYLSANPRDGKKHPAVVWLHGGFGAIGSYMWEESAPDNDQSPRQFLEADLVVCAPSRRGENDNPGQVEMYYGEVDDTLAAVDYVARLPYVDASRVYVVGHSTGGTVALLTALCTNTRIRAAVSLGGCPDLDERVAESDRKECPFDIDNPEEARLRSPRRFVESLKTPTWYFEGDGSPYGEPALAMDRAGQAARAPFTALVLRGEAATHFSIVRPITRLLAAKIKQDTGPTCNVRITPDEAAAALNEQFHPAQPVRCLTAAAPAQEQTPAGAVAAPAPAAAGAAGRSMTLTPLARQAFMQSARQMHLDWARASIELRRQEGRWRVGLSERPPRGTVFDAGEGLRVWTAEKDLSDLPADAVVDMTLAGAVAEPVVRARGARGAGGAGAGGAKQ